MPTTFRVVGQPEVIQKRAWGRLLPASRLGWRQNPGCLGVYQYRSRQTSQKRTSGPEQFHDAFGTPNSLLRIARQWKIRVGGSADAILTDVLPTGFEDHTVCSDPLRDPRCLGVGTPTAFRMTSVRWREVSSSVGVADDPSTGTPMSLRRPNPCWIDTCCPLGRAWKNC
jgi:hypothetical protein